MWLSPIKQTLLQPGWCGLRRAPRKRDGLPDKTVAPATTSESKDLGSIQEQQGRCEVNQHDYDDHRPTASPFIVQPALSWCSARCSLNYRLTHFLKWNGFLTFGFSLVYAALLTTSSSLIQNNIKPLSSPPKDKRSTSQVLSNDYSVIGGTLGGLITATVFWNRRLLSLISIIPGGIGIGVGAGLSTAYLHSLQSRSPIHPNQPPTVDDS
ncbi:hypothetical protein PtB15_6B817 [Puccinia triticina]|nr:hypothetical protein PtB15_6B817 [Puccinia triticina]